jgi:uncharacterized protein involved in exopolysaccharide biosynthesis
MLDTKDFNFFDSSSSSFDLKGFFAKLISSWKWFIVSLIITFTIAYQVNIRKEKIYGMESLIVVKDENNPFFTSNTSLVFNWGGTSNKVQTVITTLKSRSHNEDVVTKLHYYISYLEQSKYNIIDVYGITPFKVIIDDKKGQLKDIHINIKVINQKQFKVTIDFTNPVVTLNHYKDNTSSIVNVPISKFEKIYNLNEEINLPFLSFKIVLDLNNLNNINKDYSIQFNDFNETVGKYKNINVEADLKSGSVIKLSMIGTNKNRLVNYLNETVITLKNKQLESKNQFATNTINFIDSTLVQIENQIKDAEEDLKDFRKNKNIYELEDGGSLLSDKLTIFDTEKDILERKMAYYNLLKNYLEKNNDYSKRISKSANR